MFEFPWIISLYYIKNQQAATLALSFVSNCKNTLPVSDVFCVHHQDTKNCSSSQCCVSWVGMIYIQYRCPRSVAIALCRSYDIVQWQPTLDIRSGYISSRLMTCTSSCYYSFQYSWWWMQKVSETCRVILQWLINNTAKIASCWFFI